MESLRIVALASLLALVACTTPSAGFCAIAKPIRLSSEQIAALSDAEVRDVLSHNRKGQELCSWRP